LSETASEREDALAFRGVFSAKRCNWRANAVDSVFLKSASLKPITPSPFECSRLPFRPSPRADTAARDVSAGRCITANELNSVPRVDGE
jgi:hypothetical protein